MLRCRRVGAVARRSLLVALLPILAACFAVSAANAEEFGNVFGLAPPPAAEQARTASAKALAALSMLFDGLSLRELKDPQSVDRLKKAADLLEQASVAMKGVDVSALESVQFKRDILPNGDLRVIQSAFDMIGQKVPEKEPFSMAQMYSVFEAMTGQLSNAIRERTESTSPVLPEIAGLIILYVDYGATLSRLASSAK